MAKLFNTQTRLPEDVSSDQLNNALTSGTHAYELGEEVNVFDPSGNLVSMPTDQLKDALQEGYKVETQDQAQLRNFRDENSGVKGSLKAFAGNFVDEAAF